MHIGIAQIKCPAEVASPRPLDLDHAGPHVRQPKCGEGAGKKLAEIQHQNALQRSFYPLLVASLRRCHGKLLMASEYRPSRSLCGADAFGRAKLPYSTYKISFSLEKLPSKLE